MLLQYVYTVVCIRNTMVLHLISITIIQSYNKCTCIIVIHFTLIFYCPRNLIEEQSNYLQCQIITNITFLCFIKSVDIIQSYRMCTCIMQYTLPNVWCFKSDMIMLFVSYFAVIQGYIKCTCIVARWFLQNIYNCFYIYCQYVSKMYIFSQQYAYMYHSTASSRCVFIKSLMLILMKFTNTLSI